MNENRHFLRRIVSSYTHKWYLLLQLQEKRSIGLSETTMNEFGSERSRQWNIYTGSDPSPSQPVVDKETPWKNFGTSMNAISFGFVATAVLISMFLIMAIFEHLFRPNPAFSSPDHQATEAVEKLGNPQRVSTSYASDFSVVMPGELYPTYIAQPAPLPCPREGIYWPHHPHSHESNFVFP